MLGPARDNERGEELHARHAEVELGALRVIRGAELEQLGGARRVEPRVLAAPRGALNRRATFTMRLAKTSSFF